MKCALLGWGYWGKIIEKYIKENDNFFIKCIYDPQLSSETVFQDILNDKDIECVFICTPINTHYQLAKELINYGKHVFCEKPLSKNSKEIEELYDIALKNNVCLYTDYIYSNSKAINYMKDNIAEIGDIKHINAAIKQFGNFYRDDNSYEVIGVHMISAIIYILGKYNVESFEIEDNEVIRVNSNNNQVLDGVLKFTVEKQIRGQIGCSLTSICKARELEFIGEKGIMRFDMLSENTIEKMLIKEDGYKYFVVEKESVHFDENNNLKYALSDFNKEIKSGNTDNIKLSLMVTRILEKII